MIKGFWQQDWGYQKTANVQLIDTQREQEIQKIKNHFYHEFDFRKAYDLLSKNGHSSKGSTKLIGEGIHFKSYIFNRESSFPLVISIGKTNFKNNLPSSFEKWRSCLMQLKRIYMPLIPPFEIVSNSDQIGYVTPYVPDPADTSHSLWLPIKDLCDKLSRQLTRMSLVLDDYWQIKCLRGVPFIIDLSDIKAIK